MSVMTEDNSEGDHDLDMQCDDCRCSLGGIANLFDERDLCDGCYNRRLERKAMKKHTKQARVFTFDVNVDVDDPDIGPLEFRDHVNAALKASAPAPSSVQVYTYVPPSPVVHPLFELSSPAFSVKKQCMECNDTLFGLTFMLDDRCLCDKCYFKAEAKNKKVKCSTCKAAITSGGVFKDIYDKAYCEPCFIYVAPNMQGLEWITAVQTCKHCNEDIHGPHVVRRGVGVLCMTCGVKPTPPTPRVERLVPSKKKRKQEVQVEEVKEEEVCKPKKKVKKDKKKPPREEESESESEEELCVNPYEEAWKDLKKGRCMLCEEQGDEKKKRVSRHGMCEKCHLKGQQGVARAALAQASAIFRF